MEVATLTERINIQADVSAAMEKECEALRSAVSAVTRCAKAVSVVRSVVDTVPTRHSVESCDEHISKKRCCVLQ